MLYQVTTDIKFLGWTVQPTSRLKWHPTSGVNCIVSCLLLVCTLFQPKSLRQTTMKGGNICVNRYLIERLRQSGMSGMLLMPLFEHCAKQHRENTSRCTQNWDVIQNSCTLRVCGRNDVDVAVLWIIKQLSFDVIISCFKSYGLDSALSEEIMPSTSGFSCLRYPQLTKYTKSGIKHQYLTRSTT